MGRYDHPEYKGPDIQRGFLKTSAMDARTYKETILIN
jgi:hypothetical protein